MSKPEHGARARACAHTPASVYFENVIHFANAFEQQSKRHIKHDKRGRGASALLIFYSK